MNNLCNRLIHLKLNKSYSVLVVVESGLTTTP